MFVSESRAVMEVEMKVLGALVITAVAGQSATAVIVSNLATKLGGNTEHLLCDRQITRLQSSERRDMALGDDDDVNGPVRLRVVKSENLFSLGDTPDSDLS